MSGIFEGKHKEFEPGKFLWYIHEHEDWEKVHKGNAVLIIQNLGPATVMVSETPGKDGGLEIKQGEFARYINAHDQDAIIYVSKKWTGTEQRASGVMLVVPI